MHVDIYLLFIDISYLSLLLKSCEDEKERKKNKIK